MLARDHERFKGNVVDKEMIGAWLIKESIAFGTTGTVKLSQNVYTGARAAVKCVDKTIARKRKEAKNEIRCLHSASHEHVIRLEHVHEDPNFIYIFTEYYEKGDLWDYIQRHGKLDEHTARMLFRQMLDAIEFCHRRLGVCHHDVKLENCVLRADAHSPTELHLKLIDFGFAVPLDPSGPGQKTIRVFDSSPAYSAPELLLRRPHDESVDLYALGVCLYVMLTGGFPFCDSEKTTHEQLIKNIQAGVIDFPPDLSPWARELLLGLLAKVNRFSIDDVRSSNWFLGHSHSFVIKDDLYV